MDKIDIKKEQEEKNKSLKIEDEIEILALKDLIRLLTRVGFIQEIEKVNDTHIYRIIGKLDDISEPLNEFHTEEEKRFMNRYKNYIALILMYANIAKKNFENSSINYFTENNFRSEMGNIYSLIKRHFPGLISSSSEKIRIGEEIIELEKVSYDIYYELARKLDYNESRRDFGREELNSIINAIIGVGNQTLQRFYIVIDSLLKKSNIHSIRLKFPELYQRLSIELDNSVATDIKEDMINAWEIQGRQFISNIEQEEHKQYEKFYIIINPLTDKLQNQLKRLAEIGYYILIFKIKTLEDAIRDELLKDKNEVQSFMESSGVDNQNVLNNNYIDIQIPNKEEVIDILFTKLLKWYSPEKITKIPSHSDNILKGTMPKGWKPPSYDKSIS